MDTNVSKQKTPSALGACITLLAVCIAILGGLRLGIGAPMSFIQYIQRPDCIKIHIVVCCPYVMQFLNAFCCHLPFVTL